MKNRMKKWVLVAGMLCAAAGFVKAATPTPAAPMTAPKAVATSPAGKVWVNKESKTYHCEGSKFFGKTKSGEYMTEAQAKTQGYRGVRGKACIS